MTGQFFQLWFYSRFLSLSLTHSLSHSQSLSCTHTHTLSKSLSHSLTFTLSQFLIRSIYLHLSHMPLRSCLFNVCVLPLSIADSKLCIIPIHLSSLSLSSPHHMARMHAPTRTHPHAPTRTHTHPHALLMKKVTHTDAFKVNDEKSMLLRIDLFNSKVYFWNFSTFQFVTDHLSSALRHLSRVSNLFLQVRFQFCLSRTWGVFGF